MIRARLFALRRTFGQLEWAGRIRRWRRRSLRIPSPTLPNAELLRPFRGDAALDPEIRDERLVEAAVAWAEQRGVTTSTHVVPFAPRNVRRSGDHPRIRNAVLVSHCDFTGNSALHAYAIASELHRRGVSPLIAVPDDVETVRDVGAPSFPVLGYEDVIDRRLAFPDGRGPDLIHAFTPRERVRKLTRELVGTYACPHVVHLEDNDAAIVAAEVGGANAEELRRLPALVLDGLVSSRQFHPVRGRRFVETSAGVTVVTERLLELAPAHVEAVVVRPGFDDAVLAPIRSRDEVRAELGLRREDFAVVYTGSVHVVNAADMRSLYEAVAALRRDGTAVVLVKTGWNAPDVALPDLGEGIRDLGWVSRDDVPSLLAAADVLVQPGAPGPFNDFRFPAKLPDFLASGRPVILPRTNIGLSLRDGYEAILLTTGTAAELYRAIKLVSEDRDLADRLGEHGRAFALRELRWSHGVDSVESLYRALAGSERPPAPKWVLDTDPPVKVVALVSAAPSEADVRAARAHGVYGFCVPVDEALTKETPQFPICFRIPSADHGAIESLIAHLASPPYLTVAGGAFVLADDPRVAERWRSQIQKEAGLPVHLALMQGVSAGAALDRGFDSAVELPAAPTMDGGDTAMREHLATPLPNHVWFRSVGFPAKPRGRAAYRIWLRKLVLQTLCRATAQEPLIFVDPRNAMIEQQARDEWLRATSAALRDGIRQFYASRGLDVPRRRIERELQFER